MSTILAEGLTKCYGGTVAVDNCSFAIEPGTVCGFLGRNGAGKTTTIKLLVGLLWPTRGRATVLGCDCTELTPEVRSRVGYVTEGHRLPRWMRIGQLERFQRSFYPQAWDERLFAEMLDHFELSRKQAVRQLSNGQRAQVSLALTLATTPEVLIMDDPTLGLDPAVRRQFLEGIVHLIMREGRTVLFSSHILSDVERVADRLLVMVDGRLRADCSLETFRATVVKRRLHFAGGLPAEPPPGVLSYRPGEALLDAALLAQDEEALAAWATQHGATDGQRLPLTMEDQFIEFTERPGLRRRLFRWEEQCHA
jgi:ABC-2 type transport system ATP-binding protein